MSAQFENSFGGYTQQFASTASRANRLALETAESMFGLQLKTLEKNISATATYLGEFAQARDVGTYQSLLPKGLQIVRDNLERLAAANQEAVGLGLKASETIGHLAKHQFETVTDQVKATVTKTTHTK